MGMGSGKLAVTMSANQTASAVVAVLTILLSLVYIVGLYYLYRYSGRYPRALNKASSVRLQKYAPMVWIFLIFTSIIEVAISAWILGVYRATGAYPSVEAWNGMILSLFSACWTLVFATIYLGLFMHPTLWQHPAVSVGSQAVWALITWCFWVACTAILNGALPLATTGICLGIVHCSQIQALFAFAVIEMVTFTLAMFVLAYVMWRVVHEPRNGPLPY